MKIPYLSRLMSLSAIQRQSTISLTFTILITIIGFISTMLFSHILGKDLMGVYYLFLAYFGIFNMIGDGGFGSAAVKRISEGKEQNAYLTAYACLRGLLIIVSTLILLTLSPFFVDLHDYHLVPLVLLTLTSAGIFHTITMGVYGLGHVVNLVSSVTPVAVGVSSTSLIIATSVYLPSSPNT